MTPEVNCKKRLMRYELAWLTTFNVAGDYSTIDDALAAVREAAQMRGDRYVDELMLAQAAPDGDYQEIATGPELLDLARGKLPNSQYPAVSTPA